MSRQVIKVLSPLIGVVISETTIYCNPKASPAQLCPGHIPCPPCESDKCACPSPPGNQSKAPVTPSGNQSKAPAAYCNPNSKPAQFCPGNIPCPNCEGDSCACPPPKSTPTNHSKIPPSQPTNHSKVSPSQPANHSKIPPSQPANHSKSPADTNSSKPVMCNPNTEPKQFCPGGIQCPDCGEAACPCPSPNSPPTNHSKPVPVTPKSKTYKCDASQGIAVEVHQCKNLTCFGNESTEKQDCANAARDYCQIQLHMKHALTCNNATALTCDGNATLTKGFCACKKNPSQPGNHHNKTGQLMQCDASTGESTSQLSCPNCIPKNFTASDQIDCKKQAKQFCQNATGLNLTHALTCLESQRALSCEDGFGTTGEGICCPSGESSTNFVCIPSNHSQGNASWVQPKSVPPIDTYKELRKRVEADGNKTNWWENDKVYVNLALNQKCPQQRAGDYWANSSMCTANKTGYICSLAGSDNHGHG